uniref:Receptor expression-enhancing protein n=1 Tax=Rousettus aegyptiacus TaxID=9407 RepID=A0A7J8BUV0_ROUAE|nr:receptor accessory protein 4 [Rousettus aegyptiacus]
MVSWMICRLVVLVFGMLYPAYASYKAVKTKNIREYVRWMMYWIVFALFMAAETFTDIFISWFPFYYEIKMAFVLWLLSPYTKGASLLYRKFVHPSLSRHEKEIDTCIVQAKERSYETVLSFGKRGLNIAATAAVQAATKSQGALAGRLRSFSGRGRRPCPQTWAVRADATCAVLPRVLRGPQGCSEGRSGCASPPRLCPPGSCCWLMARGRCCQGHAQRRPTTYQSKRAQGSIYCLSHSSTCAGVGPEPSLNPCE